MRYIITEYKLKTKRSKRPAQVNIKTLNTLREAENYCLELGMSYVGETYIGGFKVYRSNNLEYIIKGSVELANGQSIVASY